MFPFDIILPDKPEPIIASIIESAEKLKITLNLLRLHPNEHFF
jgi:hypothetical protein